VVRVLLRPLPAWTDPVTAARSNHNFKTAWASTLDLLRREVEALARPSDWDCEVVVQVQAEGRMRADTKAVEPGVVISFTSRHGPLRYACDTFDSFGWHRGPGWQANVRAIALGLQALRKVDRYGITRSGEQYAGWGQLSDGTECTVDRMTEAQARDLLARWMHYPHEFSGDWWARRAAVDSLYRRAAKSVHPDAGGDGADFKRLAMARNLLVNV
jgi:hypothetical protein